MSNLEEYFKPFRDNTIGINKTFISPYGEKRIVYADWIASGRLYEPIEKKICEVFGPMVGNTQTQLTKGNPLHNLILIKAVVLKIYL